MEEESNSFSNLVKASDMEKDKHTFNYKIQKKSVDVRQDHLNSINVNEQTYKLSRLGKKLQDENINERVDTVQRSKSMETTEVNDKTNGEDFFDKERVEGYNNARVDNPEDMKINLNTCKNEISKESTVKYLKKEFSELGKESKEIIVTQRCNEQTNSHDNIEGLICAKQLNKESDERPAIECEQLKESKVVIKEVDSKHFNRALTYGSNKEPSLRENERRWKSKSVFGDHKNETIAHKKENNYQRKESATPSSSSSVFVGLTKISTSQFAAQRKSANKHFFDPNYEGISDNKEKKSESRLLKLGVDFNRNKIFLSDWREIRSRGLGSSKEIVRNKNNDIENDNINISCSATHDKSVSNEFEVSNCKNISFKQENTCQLRNFESNKDFHTSNEETQLVKCSPSTKRKKTTTTLALAIAAAAATKRTTTTTTTTSFIQVESAKTIPTAANVFSTSLSSLSYPHNENKQIKNEEDLYTQSKAELTKVSSCNERLLLSPKTKENANSKKIQVQSTKFSKATKELWYEQKKELTYLCNSSNEVSQNRAKPPRIVKKSQVGNACRENIVNDEKSSLEITEAINYKTSKIDQENFLHNDDVKRNADYCKTPALVVYATKKDKANDIKSRN